MINNSDENNMEPSFLNQIEAAMENIRVASSHENSPRRNFSNGSNSIDINTENYSTLVEKLKVEKAELEKERINCNMKICYRFPNKTTC